MGVADVVRELDLERHPEGGWFRETWRGPDGPGGRPVGTSILYLLGADEGSAWHRIDADEVWHFHAGAPLELDVSLDGVSRSRTILGRAVDGSELPQAVVPAGAWQSARTRGEWTLVGCTVAPGFVDEGFELAPPGWEPPGR
ncbi:MAG: cupin domain-containing protein [Gemmatimonadota bacterium]|nr:cupin domain-containing protein [Gemmatimonadota bacterium]